MADIVRVPALWISSENDGYTNFAIETRQLYRGARGHARRLRPGHAFGRGALAQ